jgi:hypothetical protein
MSIINKQEVKIFNTNFKGRGRGKRFLHDESLKDKKPSPPTDQHFEILNSVSPSSSSEQDFETRNVIACIEESAQLLHDINFCFCSIAISKVECNSKEIFHSFILYDDIINLIEMKSLNHWNNFFNSLGVKEIEKQNISVHFQNIMDNSQHVIKQIINKIRTRYFLLSYNLNSGISL